VSVDGFLAHPDDALDFLHTGEQEARGFKEFLASVDAVVIGRRTFDVVLKLGHLALYGKKPVVVLSSRPRFLIGQRRRDRADGGRTGRNLYSLRLKHAFDYGIVNSKCTSAIVNKTKSAEFVHK
jgi:hypothetical protein